MMCFSKKQQEALRRAYPDLEALLRKLPWIGGFPAEDPIFELCSHAGHYGYYPKDFSKQSVIAVLRISVELGAFSPVISRKEAEEVQQEIEEMLHGSAFPSEQYPPHPLEDTIGTKRPLSWRGKALKIRTQQWEDAGVKRWYPILVHSAAILFVTLLLAGFLFEIVNFFPIPTLSLIGLGVVPAIPMGRWLGDRYLKNRLYPYGKPSDPMGQPTI